MEEVEYLCFSTKHQEEVITQIADLNRFIESYSTEIELVDWMRRQVNIIKGSGEKKVLSSAIQKSWHFHHLFIKIQIVYYL